MQQFNEGLLAGDLRLLVRDVFEIDSYKSKMGTDKDIVVVSFTVETAEPAEDLEDFVEKSYDFVLDADVTPGELNDGTYKVFVEFERTRHVAEQIIEMLDGIGKLANIDAFKFRYYKSFHSVDANEENLKSTVPMTKDDYENTIKENVMNNFSNFFNRSYLDTIVAENDELVFQKKYSGPLRMRIKEFGNSSDIYENIKGPLMLESAATSEILFLTKYLGNYNITKIGNVFIFENENYAVSMEKV